jgi:lactoylglutathione lyase
MRGVFEVHLSVTDLDRSIAFYVAMFGLQVGLRGDVDASRADAHSRGARRFALLWIGGPGRAMLGLWERPAEQVLPQHFAFEVGLEELAALATDLVGRGVEVRDFFHRRTTVPTVFSFIPAASLYLDDPDGHVLELLAPLGELARPELSVVSWSV